MDAIFGTNEFRRKYMKTIVNGIQQEYDVPKKEAKKAASLVLGFLQKQAEEGEVINLGFLKLTPETREPRVISSVLTGQTHYRGETKKWKINWSQKWLRDHSPSWRKCF